ncbi:MAG TPA: P-loop NTPase, partial [Nitrososphaerales archaeon]|nr:P-loop NTPase [Nitrososphaerales archaeon]
MASKEEMISKLREVVDPEIGINIVDLEMVRKLEINGSNVDIDIALTVKGCPLAGTIEKDINRVLGGLSGVSKVTVKMSSMTKEEVNKLSLRLQQMKADQKSVGKAPGLSAGIDKLEKKGIQNIIAVMSGKGGVGKSYVTAMIAVELRRQGYEVGILDGDITGPSVAKIFGLSGKPFADEIGVVPKTTD